MEATLTPEWAGADRRTRAVRSALDTWKDNIRACVKVSSWLVSADFWIGAEWNQVEIKC